MMIKMIIYYYLLLLLLLLIIIIIILLRKAPLQFLFSSQSWIIGIQKTSFCSTRSVLSFHTNYYLLSVQLPLKDWLRKMWNSIHYALMTY